GARATCGCVEATLRRPHDDGLPRLSKPERSARPDVAAQRLRTTPAAARRSNGNVEAVAPHPGDDGRPARVDRSCRPLRSSEARREQVRPSPASGYGTINDLLADGAAAPLPPHEHRFTRRRNSEIEVETDAACAERARRRPRSPPSPCPP